MRREKYMVQVEHGKTLVMSMELMKTDDARSTEEKIRILKLSRCLHGAL